MHIIICKDQNIKYSLILCVILTITTFFPVIIVIDYLLSQINTFFHIIHLSLQLSPQGSEEQVEYHQLRNGRS